MESGPVFPVGFQGDPGDLGVGPGEKIERGPVEVGDGDVGGGSDDHRDRDLVDGEIQYFFGSYPGFTHTCAPASPPARHNIIGPGGEEEKSG